MDPFIVKKIISAVLMPMPMAFIALMLAVLFYLTSRKKIAACITTFVLLGIYLLSLSPISRAISSPLETHYPKYQQQVVSFVLVLGSGHSSDERKPLSSLLSTVALMRLFEGINIYNANPGAKLLLSGYKALDEISNALAMQKVAVSMGVPFDDIVLAEDVKDTAEESLFWMNYLLTKSEENRRLALVTSATHMPRSMSLFNQLNTETYGVDIIPSPTEYISIPQRDSGWQAIVPGANSLYRVERAWHEYLGMAWAFLNR